MFDEAIRRRFEALIPCGEMGHPGDIATVALVLACDDSSFVKGVELALTSQSASIVFCP